MSGFTDEGILKLCPNKLSGRLEISLFDELDSTNTYLKRLARAGAEEGRVIIARRQSAGRGRLGRSFYSDAEGLYISVLIRPRMRAEGMVFITAMTAVAMARAIERTVNADARIKWVNDIFVNGKKVCGILCESAFGANALSEYVVIGAGVNITEPLGGFPADISAVAGALLPAGEKRELRNALAAAFLEELFNEYACLGMRRFLGEYRRRSIVTGKSVSVISPAGTRQAEATAIDDDCRLVVRYDDGTTEHISTGEISVRLINTP